MTMFYQMTIPPQQAVDWSNGITQGKGLTNRIQVSSCDMSVVFLNNPGFGDIYYAIPQCHLGTTYIVIDKQSCVSDEEDDQNSKLYITSGDYNITIVTISKPNEISERKHFLSRYEQVVLDHYENMQDHTGIIITGSNPVSVITSHNNFCFNGSEDRMNALFEQLIPMDYFGRLFHIPDFSMDNNHNFDSYAGYIRVVASETNTNVLITYNDDQMNNLTGKIHEGGYVEQYVNTPAEVTCSKPCSVALFWHFKDGSNHGNYAPSMTIVPGINLYKTGKTYFSTTIRNHFYHTYLTVVTKLTGKGDVRLNQGILTGWKILSADFLYVNVRVDSGGMSVLDSITSPYMAYLNSGRWDSRHQTASHPVVMNFN